MLGCRDDFTNAQDKLQAQLGEFDAWRTGSFMVRTFGGGNFPSNNLTAKVGNQTLHGQAAEDQM
jgi:hypothetical protein